MRPPTIRLNRSTNTLARIVTSGLIATALLTTSFASADQVIDDDLVVNDDLIVLSSICAGPTCTDGESFGFETLRLKTDNPSILFLDTSTSASFPRSDWMMGVLDDALQPSIFYIEDASGGGVVLQLGSAAQGGAAIGFGSVLEADAISVGAPGAERQIKHVAEGLTDSDAVNVAQFNLFENNADAAVESGLAGLETRVDELDAALTDLVSRLENL